MALNTYGEKTVKDTTLSKNLLRKVDELELSVRSANCLKDVGIVYIGDLVRKFENDMLRIPNFGRKSLNEIREILMQMGLNLGMDISESPEDIRYELIEFERKRIFINNLKKRIRDTEDRINKEEKESFLLNQDIIEMRTLLQIVEVADPTRVLWEELGPLIRTKRNTLSKILELWKGRKIK